MSVNWSWKEKAGTVTQVLTNGEERTQYWYVGNAYMVVPFEYKENGKDMYMLDWFFVDKEHAMRCLGLMKNANGTTRNIFGDRGITQFTVYMDRCRHWKVIAALFRKAFPDIPITVYGKAPVTERGDK